MWDSLGRSGSLRMQVYDAHLSNESLPTPTADVNPFWGPPLEKIHDG